MAEVRSPSHLLHFFISLFTCGFWLLVWIAVALDPAMNCRTCGGRAYSSRTRLRLEKGAIYSGVALFVLFAVLATIALIMGPKR